MVLHCSFEYPILLKFLILFNQQLVNILPLKMWLTCSVQCLFHHPLTAICFHFRETQYTFSRLSILSSFAVTHSLGTQDLSWIHLLPVAEVWVYINYILLQGDSFDIHLRDTGLTSLILLGFWWQKYSSLQILILPNENQQLLLLVPWRTLSPKKYW